MYAVPEVFTPRDIVAALNKELEGQATVELKEISREVFVENRKLNEELWAK